MAATIPVDTGSRPVITILSVKVYIDPSNQASFWTHFKTTFDHVVAEPECRYFVVGHDAMDPTCLSWTEGWSEDVTWLQEVRGSQLNNSSSTTSLARQALAATGAIAADAEQQGQARPERMNG